MCRYHFARIEHNISQKALVALNQSAVVNGENVMVYGFYLHKFIKVEAYQTNLSNPA